MSCADPVALVTAAEEAVWELRVSDAETALAGAEAAFGCGPVAADVLARFFVAEGALAMHAGDATGAEGRFRTARALRGDPPDPNYGSKVRKAFDTVPSVPVDASIDVSPKPTGRTDVWIDTLEVQQLPASVPAGLHLVQAGRDGVQFGEVVLAASGETLVVNSHLADVVAPVPGGTAPQTSTSPSRSRPRVPLLAASGGALLLGSLSAVLSSGAHGRIPEAKSVDEVDALHGRQLAFGWTAYTLWGGAAVGVGLSFL